MRVVVDTNVIAYYLLGTEQFVDEVKAFWSGVTTPLAPASWEAELTNVLWMAVRAKVLSEGEAIAKLDYVGSLGIDSIPISAMWRGALARSIRSGVAVYDTLFVELADKHGIALATFDGPVLRAFPSIARRPRELVGGG